jgi:hypothetical protein
MRLFFKAVVARTMQLNTKRMQPVVFAVALLFSLALVNSQQLPLAYADVSCKPINGGTCSFANNLWGSHYDCYTYYNSSYLRNSFVESCLESYVISGTGDNKRYFYFDPVTTINPDTSYGVITYGGSGNGDSSQNGTYSTVQTRLWSTARTQGCNNYPGYCDQQAYPPMQPNDYCSPNGGSHTVSGQFTVGVLTINFQENDPIYYGCVNKASVPDVYSSYTDYTRINGNSGSEFTLDAPSGQWGPNGYNGRQEAIGWSFFGHYWRGSTQYWIQSPNLMEQYNY